MNIISSSDGIKKNIRNLVRTVKTVEKPITYYFVPPFYWF